ncbi:MAG: hypothetical protein Q8P67_23760, partial [archaeon]|nr:hypothetical protein [archaeon]
MSAGYPRPIDDPRGNQLRELQVRFPDLRAVTPGSVYDLHFRTDAGSALMLRVTLPPRFPSDPPEFYLSPVGRHPLLTEAGRVLPAAHHSLTSWS